VRRSTAPGHRYGRLVGGATALTTLALCCGSTTPALAAPKTTTAHKVVKDPLAGARKKALADVTVYGKRLSVVLHNGAVAAMLSSDDELSLHDEGVLQGVALRDDRVTVMRVKTGKALAAAVAAASRTVLVAGLELKVIAAAETHLAAGDPLEDAMATLSDEATTAAANGDDTTDLTDDLASLSTDLESAQGDESLAVSDVLELAPSASAAAVKAAAAAGVDDLAVIDQDISDANDDLALAQSDYDALGDDGGTDPGNDPGDGS
jgi:hypothetical protein